ncbi:hypothetical protein PanWU01x14_108430, partial [Parasponia andersonii]
ELSKFYEELEKDNDLLFKDNERLRVENSRSKKILKDNNIEIRYNTKESKEWKEAQEVGKEVQGDKDARYLGKKKVEETAQLPPIFDVEAFKKEILENLKKELKDKM